MSEVPEGWKMVPLAVVCEVNPRDPGPTRHSTAVSFVPMPSVSETEGAIMAHDTKPFSKVAKGYTRFRERDVIFAKITPCMENGKSAVASGLHAGFACGSTEFHVLRSKGEILPEYLWRFLRQKAFRNEAERHMTGAVGQRRVPSQYIKDTLIPLPPLQEQHRIVDRLGGLFKHTKVAREQLGHIPRLIQRYKGAVLAAAFSGVLTKEWRSENGISLDGDWREKMLGVVSTDVRYGAAAKCHYQPKRVPVLRIPNVVDGRIDLRDLKYGSFSKQEQEKLALKAGDLLVIRSNGSLDLVGRAALVPKSVAGYLYAGYLIRIRLDCKQVYPPFVQHAFYEPSIRQHIESLAKSTSGVNNINSEQLKAITLRIPPLEEQKEIVEKIQSAFSSIDHLRDDAIGADKLLDRLDQATLAKAFRGELVGPRKFAEPMPSRKGRRQ